MIKNHKILALIIAREKSKGLRNKNTIIFKKKPLIQWTMEAAKKSKLIDKILISTDSKKIIKLAKKKKIFVPFLRPKKLSSSKAKIKSVIFHMLKWLKDNKKLDYEYLILLQATSPLRNHIHIDKAIKYYFKRKKKETDTLVSVREMEKKTQWIMKRNGELISFIFKQKRERRQELENLYLPNGAIYLCNIKKFKGNFFGKRTLFFLMDEKSSLDIDSQKDLKIN